MRTTAVTNGTLEPVTLDDLKTYARTTSGNVEDTSLTLLIKAARHSCEAFGRFAISPRQWQTSYKTPTFRSMGFALGSSVTDPDNVVSGLLLPRRPLVSLETLSWVSDTGVVTELSADTDYNFVLATERVYWRDKFPLSNDAAALVATYTAGFPPEEVEEGAEPTKCIAPDEVRMAILLTATHWYENRASEKDGTLPTDARDVLRGWWRSASLV